MSTLNTPVRISNPKYRFYTNGSTVYCIDRAGTITYDTDWGNLLQSIGLVNGYVMFDEGVYPANTVEWSPTGTGVPGSSQMFVCGAGTDLNLGSVLTCGPGKRAVVPKGGVGLHLSDFCIKGATTGTSVNIIDGLDTEVGYYNRCSMVKGSLKRLRIQGGVGTLFPYSIYLKNPEWCTFEDLYIGAGTPVPDVNGFMMENSVNAGTSFGENVLDKIEIACNGAAQNICTLSNHPTRYLNQIRASNLWLRNASGSIGSTAMYLQKLKNSDFYNVHFENTVIGIYVGANCVGNSFWGGKQYNYVVTGGTALYVASGGYASSFRNFNLCSGNSYAWVNDSNADANAYSLFDDITLQGEGGTFTQIINAATYLGKRRRTGPGVFPAGFPS